TLNINNVFVFSPAQLTRKMIKEIKAAKSLEPLSKYIDWRGAFNSMSAEQKKVLKINNPKDLEKYEKWNYSQIGLDIKKSIEKNMKNASGKKLKWLKSAHSRLSAVLSSQQKEFEEKIVNTSYTVGKVAIKDNKAEVELIKILGKKEKSETVHFIKRGDSWFLKSAAPFNPLGASADKSANTMFGRSIASPTEALVVHPY
ncbi:MAG: hypothetical protein D6780_06230, partial [Candidatus Dadabacteria bacterium]